MSNSPATYIHSSWPAIGKTAAMLQMEKDHGGKDIRDILLEQLANCPTDKEAARVLNIDNTTMSTWLVKLRIDNHASVIRTERRDI